MEVFLEKQYLKPLWRFMMILAVIFVIIGLAYLITLNAEDDVAIIVSVISIVMIIFIAIPLYNLKLETRIDEKGIFTYFSPMKFTQKFFPWEEVKACYVRKYRKVEESRDFKRRGLGKNWRAHNVAGNDGIEIHTRDGEKFLLSTLKPQAAEKTIKHYLTSVQSNLS